MQPYIAAHPASSFVITTQAEAADAAPISSMSLSSYIPTTGFAYGNDVFWTLNTSNQATLLGNMTLFGRISEDGTPLGLEQLDEMKLHTREIVVQRSFNGRISNASGFGHYISKVVANVSIRIRLKPPCSYEFTYEEAATDISQFKKKSQATLGFNGYEGNTMIAWPYYYTPTSSFQDEVNKDLLSTYYADDYWARYWMPPLLSGQDEVVSSSVPRTRDFSFLDFRSTVKEDQDIFFTSFNSHNLATNERMPIVWHNIDSFKADRDSYKLTDRYYSQRLSPTPSYSKDYHKYCAYFCNSGFVSGYEELTSTYFGPDTIIGDIQ